MPRRGPSLGVASRTTATERALEAAVAAANTFVGHEALRAAWYALWPDASAPAEVEDGRWGRLLAWAIREGRVVTKTRGRAAFYAPTGHAALPLPPESEPAPRTFGDRAVAESAAAERALALAHARAGGPVDGKAVARAWREATGVDMPRHLVGRVSRALEPAVAAGRVGLSHDARHTYYETARVPTHVPAPATADIRRECDDAGERGDARADHREAPVAGPQAPAEPSGPSVAAPASGVSGSTTSAASAPTDAPVTTRLAARAGTYPSDMMRVEEATRRAAAAADSGVLLTRIEAQLSADPALRLRHRTPVGVLAQRLVATGRLVRVAPRFAPNRNARHAVYYSTSGGPSRVRVAELAVPDRRFAAVHALWRAAGERPCSTAALRRYLDGHPAFAIPDDPPHGWANALQAFRATGDVARVTPTDDERFVLWAPGPEWRALAEDEQRRRARDAYGRALRGWEGDVADSLHADPGDERMGSAYADDEPHGAGEREDHLDDASADDASSDVAWYDATGGSTAGPFGAAAPTAADLRYRRTAPPPGSLIPRVGKGRRSPAASTDTHASPSRGERRRARGVAEDAPRHDVLFRSRNRDLRALVRATQAHLAANAAVDDVSRAVVAARPVTAAQVAVVAASRTHLLPRSVSVPAALQEASRVRPGMRRPAVVRVGVADDVAYYDVPSSRAAGDTPGPLEAEGRAGGTTRDRHALPALITHASVAFVRYRQALADAAAGPLERDLARLCDAADQDATGLVPLGPTVLGARAGQLGAVATARADALECAWEEATLLPDEARALGALRDRLRRAAETAAGLGARQLLDGEAEGLPDATGDAPPRRLMAAGERGLPLAEVRDRLPGGAPSWDLVLIDTRRAASQLDGLVAYAMADPRALSARLRHSVAALRPSREAWPGAQAGASGCATDAAAPGGSHNERTRRGRRVGVYLDRVAFACYATTRFASGLLAPFAARAQHAVGALRDPAPFASALTDATRKAAHAPALAALGVFDDAASRDAVASYLLTATAPGGATRAGAATAAALPTALLALAPKPFGGIAESLTTHERRALTAAAEGEDTYLRDLARRVLGAWDERWVRDQLLQL